MPAIRAVSIVTAKTSLKAETLASFFSFQGSMIWNKPLAALISEVVLSIPLVNN